MEINLSLSVIKISVAAASSFVVAFLFTPLLLGFLKEHRMWRKTVRTKALGGGDLPNFQKFHSEGEVKTPRFGGVLVWLVPPFMALVFFLLSHSGLGWFEKLSFLSRNQTWLPLGTLLAASAVGFLDDLLQVITVSGNSAFARIWKKANTYIAGGLELKHRLFLVSCIGLVGAWWFFTKLGIDTIHVPGVGDFSLGLLYIPLFVIVMIAVYSGGVIDGLDGLSGGTFAVIFAAFSIIAFSHGQIDLAAFCLALVGALLAFLWHNIPPAKFYMSETGTMGLCATLTVVAFLTDSVFVLPIIAFPLVLESGSVIVQLLSKKIRKKKVLLAAPIHHHFEALGWPHYQVTMRFWIIGIVMAVIGVAIRLLG